MMWCQHSGNHPDYRSHLGGGTDDCGQRGLLQPIRRARGGAQQLGGGGAEVSWTAKLGGMTVG